MRGAEVRPYEREFGGHGQGDDVVHLHGEDGQPEARALPAERLVAQHLGTHGLPAGGPVDAGHDGVAAGAVVLPVRVAAGA